MKLLERRRNLIGAFARFIRFISGKPPLTLEACVNDKSTIDYKVYGESVQDGTPTPDAPIEVESVGEKTVNLFDINNMEYIHYGSSYFYPKVEDGLFISPGKTGVSFYYMPVIKVEPSTTYVVSFKEVSGVNNRVIFLYDDMNKTNTISISKSTFIDSTRIFTLTTSDTSNYLAIGVSGANSYTAIISNIQIEKGDTFTEYQPYGKYKIPIRVNSQNLFDIENPVYAANSQNNLGRKPKIENGIVYFNTYYANAGGAGFVVPMPPNMTFTISWENVSGSHWSEIFEFEYAENGIMQNWHRFTPQLKDATTLTYTQSADKRYILIVLGCIDGYYKAGIKNLQVTVGADVKPYEPYQEPITTNIYLDEPLRKIGDYADYIDFENQVVVRNTGCHTFEGTEEISIPGSVIEGYTPFRHIYTARQPFVCNYLPFLAKDYPHAVSECLAKYSTGGQMFFVISNDRIPLNDITSFKSWLINLKDNGNPLKVYYRLSSYVEEPIELPQLPTFKGTTIYSVDTNIQPSNMEVTYYSKERSVS